MDNNTPSRDYIKKFYETGQLMHQSADRGFAYNYSFAELCDRASIVLMKIANSNDTNKEAFEQELRSILHDIQLHINQTPIDAEMIKGIIVLTQVNSFIWGNESFVRDADDNGNVDDETLLSKLKESHKANSLRAAAKKHIQNQRGERVDEKLNYGRDAGMWNIKW